MTTTTVPGHDMSGETVFHRFEAKKPGQLMPKVVCW